MKLQRTDFSLGVGAIALAGVWLYVASGIEESMLSDATGAGGIPRVLGYVMIALGLLLCLRSVSFAASAPGAKPAEPALQDGPPPSWKNSPHLKALVLLAILAGYVVLAPHLGYLLGTAVLLGVVAAYGGAPVNRNLLLISAGGGIALWLSFAWALGISMQTSALLDWF